MVQRTLCIIKPDAVEDKEIGEIIARLEFSEFEIVDICAARMNREMASEFYAEHIGKPFFDGLVEFMTSGAIFAVLLESEDAIARLRKILGNTDPDKAAHNTIRYLYGSKLPRNAAHGSDSPESAMREIDFFFGFGKWICGK